MDTPVRKGAEARWSPRLMLFKATVLALGVCLYVIFAFTLATSQTALAQCEEPGGNGNDVPSCTVVETNEWWECRPGPDGWKVWHYCSETRDAFIGILCSGPRCTPTGLPCNV